MDSRRLRTRGQTWPKKKPNETKCVDDEEENSTVLAVTRAVLLSSTLREEKPVMVLHKTNTPLEV